MTRLLLIALAILFFTPETFCAQEDLNLRIQGFAVEGNRKTKEWLIIRECGFQVGDTIRQSDVEQVSESLKTNVKNLQLFATVDVSPIVLPESEVIFLITVTERWYFYPAPFIQLVEPNFNVWWRNRKESRTNYGIKVKQYNFRGRNEKLALTLKFGYTREFNIKYSSPYLIKGKNWGFNVRARYKENEEINTGTIDNERIFYNGENSRTRIEQYYALGTSYRPGIFQNHTLTLAYDNIVIADSARIAFPDYLQSENKRLRQMRLTYTYDKTNVDNKGYPLKGLSYGLQLEKKGLGIIEGAADVLDLSATIKKYIPLSGRLTSQHSLSAKSTLFQNLPYYLQRGLGYGNNAVRSFEFYIMDGQHYALSRNNLNFNVVKQKKLPIPKGLDRMFPEVGLGLYANLIFDIGYVKDDLYAELNSLNNELLLGTGLGLDLVSNYDYVFRMEYTINHLSEHGFYLHYRKSI